MSKELLIISCFKEKKISYYLDQKKGEIHFTCPHCGEMAIISVQNTRWKCKNCDNEGSLVSLALLEDEKVSKERVFNPRERRRSINNKINKVLAQLSDQTKIHQELQIIKRDVNELVEKLIKSDVKM
jgi:predicted RNA-binding Zn-ribbon protein involved in translation (DUF1610 family)